MRWQVRENNAFQEKVFYAAPNGGPDLFVFPRPGYNKKYAIFSTRFGSIDHAFRWNEEGKEDAEKKDKSKEEDLKEKAKDALDNIFGKKKK